jgi:hypothetical protein
MKITQEMKLDAMSGFCGLKPVPVWKLTFPAIWMFKTVAKTLKGLSIGTGPIHTEDIMRQIYLLFFRFFQ